MRIALWILLGAGLMFVILKILSSKTVTSSSDTWRQVKALVKTQEVANLVRTNEFREIVKTKEFTNLVKTLAEDQLVTVAQTLAG